MGCTLGLRVWRLGQLIWEVSRSPVLPTGVGCTCAYGVCWSCGAWAAEWVLGEQNPVSDSAGRSLTCWLAGADCKTQILKNVHTLDQH